MACNPPVALEILPKEYISNEKLSAAFGSIECEICYFNKKKVRFFAVQVLFPARMCAFGK
jgi:hypothetical protein